MCLHLFFFTNTKTIRNLTDGVHVGDRPLVTQTTRDSPPCSLSFATCTMSSENVVSCCPSEALGFRDRRCTRIQVGQPGTHTRTHTHTHTHTITHTVTHTHSHTHTHTCTHTHTRTHTHTYVHEHTHTQREHTSIHRTIMQEES